MTMYKALIFGILAALPAGCVAVGEGDRDAYAQLTDERLTRLDEKLVRWSNARNRDDLILEAVLRRDLRREAGRLVDALKLGLASGDPVKRATCAATLGFSEDVSAVGLLVELLKDGEPDVRAASMLGLCLLGTSRIPATPVVERLSDADPLVRRLAVLCLQNLYDPVTQSALFDHFVQGLRDPDDGVRVNASSVLGSLQEVRAAPFLATVALKDASGRVRKNAAIGLGRLKVQDTAKDLVVALEKEMNQAVLREIVAALEEITGKELGDEAGPWKTYVKKMGPAPMLPGEKESEKIPEKK